MNPHVLICLAALPALAQAPVWANLSIQPSEASVVTSPIMSSLVVQGGRTVDLGAVDGDKPVSGVITISNRGLQPFNLLVPMGLSATPLRVQFPGAKAVPVPPGGKLELPFDYDARGDESAGAFSVVLATDDPGAPLLEQDYTLQATHAAYVAPYRDLLMSADKAVPFCFIPTGSAPFASVAVEDPSAPVTLAFTVNPDNGRVDGEALLDMAKIAAGAPQQGSVRVIATTNSGSTAYFWLQWVQ